LPVSVDFKGANRKIVWNVAPELLDYHHYLPLFFEGLREVKDPYMFLADKSIDEMLEKGPEKVLAVLPQLIMPMKAAFNTKRPSVIVRTLRKLQLLVRCSNDVGEALVAYYRQLLPVLNMFKNKRLNIGDQIDYGQQKQENLADLISETLELLERTGGEDAFINIKYMVPTYESCVF